jgi:hypothetical protein
MQRVGSHAAAASADSMAPAGLPALRLLHFLGSNALRHRI